ncbi:MAG: VOC family protein [Chloroflexota bacterium]
MFSSQKITPFLWFDNNAEEAVNYYISIFKNSKLVSLNRFPDAVPEMAGKVMTAVFELDGQPLMALDGGPHFKFTEAISLFVDCETQEEVDEYWEKLSAGGEIQQCGWLKDKFGLSWQIVPRALGEMMQDEDQAKAGRVMQAMLQMKKIDLNLLKQAYDQE